MKKFLLYLWQLPQHILGLLVIFFTGAKRNDLGYWESTGNWFGVSLGNYIVFRRPKNTKVDSNSIKHEQGHQVQSKYLGPLYLIIIGIPSGSFNLIDRFFHSDWEEEKRLKWYYSLLWEHSADKLGGVDRGYDK